MSMCRPVVYILIALMEVTLHVSCLEEGVLVDVSVPTISDCEGTCAQSVVGENDVVDTSPPNKMLQEDLTPGQKGENRGRRLSHKKGIVHEVGNTEKRNIGKRNTMAGLSKAHASPHHIMCKICWQWFGKGSINPRRACEHACEGVRGPYFVDIFRDCVLSCGVRSIPGGAKSLGPHQSFTFMPQCVNCGFGRGWMKWMCGPCMLEM